MLSFIPSSNCNISLFRSSDSTLGDCTDCVVVGLRITVYDVDGIALDVDDTVLDVEDGRVFEVGVGVTRDAMRLLDCV